MSNDVVRVSNLSRRFGETVALDDVSLTIKPGLVYGVVGGNGQGKTTLIKHILGLLRAKSGTVEVFGLDPVKSPVEVLSRIGYLSEAREMPDWMTICELLRYTSAFHPSWDFELQAELLETFQLDATKRIKNLSKGMRAQTGLITAVAARPELLLLDEPSTGLDAIVRKDILNAIIRTVADEGRSAVFSSHLLDEVEKMSDYIFLIDSGKVVLEGELDQIKENHHVFNVRLGSGKSDCPKIEGALAVEQRGDLWNVVVQGAIQPARESVASADGEITNLRNANLEEIFVARVGKNCLEPADSGAAK